MSIHPSLSALANLSPVIGQGFTGCEKTPFRMVLKGHGFSRAEQEQ
jgi:hypothetical protein